MPRGNCQQGVTGSTSSINPMWAEFILQVRYCYLLNSPHDGASTACASDIWYTFKELNEEIGGTAVAWRLRCCATIRKVAGSIPAGVSGFFIDIKSFRSHYGCGVDSDSNRNEYQEYFLGGKGSRCIRLTTLPPSCAVVTKSGNLNFLEPSGPGQAWNGTALF